MVLVQQQQKHKLGLVVLINSCKVT